VIKKFVYYTRIWVTILAPLALVLLPVDFFDHGESVCLSKTLAGLECPACGLTRGVMHFLHFDFGKAWAFNKFTFVVIPLLFPVWLKAVYEAKGKPLPRLMNKLM